MTVQAIELAGARLLADITGALIWPEASTVVVADLHLEKASSYARGGMMLPPYDTRATIARLEEVLARPPSKRVVGPGDSFHDAHNPARIEEEDACRLAAMLRGRD